MNNLQQVPLGPLPFQPQFQPPANPGTAADFLVNKISLFRQMVSRELGVTRYGNRLLDEAATLEAAAAQYRDTVNSPRSTDRQMAIVGQNLTSAYQDVAEEFRTVPSASSACQNLLWEISRLVQFSESAARPNPAQFPNNPNPNTNATLKASAERLGDSLRQFASFLTANYPESPFNTNLYRDVSGMAVQADSLRALSQMPPGPGGADLQRVAMALLTQARDVARQLTNADFRLQQG